MFRKFTIAAILTSAAFVAAPRTALADHRFDTRRDHDRNDHRDWRHDDHSTGNVDIRIGSGSFEHPPVIIAPPPEQVWVPPVTRTVSQQVWVPATYTTVVDRVWVEPVTRKVEERAWIGDRYESRDVARWEDGRRVTRQEQVLVEAGHYATVCRDEVITPGHYEDRPRQQLVCGGHYEIVTREETIAPGHWETRPTRVVLAPPPHDEFQFGIHIGR